MEWAGTKLCLCVPQGRMSPVLVFLLFCSGSVLSQEAEEVESQPLRELRQGSGAGWRHGLKQHIESKLEILTPGTPGHQRGGTLASSSADLGFSCEESGVNPCRATHGVVHSEGVYSPEQTWDSLSG